MNEYTALTKDIICEKLKSMAKEKKKLLIVCHRNPDCDTVGSAFALKLIYESLGGSAKCVCDADAPKYLHFLYSGQTTVNFRAGDDTRHDVFCAVDVASSAQLGRLEYLSRRFELMIDHHGLGKPFAPNWIEPHAAACAELIYKIYRKLSLEGSIARNADIARRIYAAICADCGSFKYPNTTSETFMTAAALADELAKAEDGGIGAAEISHLLFDNRSKSELAAQKLTIENIRYTADDKIAYAVLCAKDIKNAGLTSSDLGGAVDIVRSIEGVMLGIIIREDKCGEEFRISSRSNCGVNVARVCARFGGGGHEKAAGASVTADSGEAAEQTVISAFSEALSRYTEDGALK